MKLLECRFLADENFDPASIEFLKSSGVDVAPAAQANLLGQPDTAVLRAAVNDGRVVLSHDRDFGALGMLGADPLVGIVLIRPGHINSTFTNRTLQALIDANPDVTLPFILVARQRDGIVTIRVRGLRAPRT